MTVVLFFLGIVATLFAGWRTLRRVRFFLHIFQLETYKFDRYGRWLADHVRSGVLRPSHGVGALLLGISGGMLSVTSSGWIVAFLFLGWSMTFISSRRYRSDREKKPLTFTPRMTRLAITTGILAAVPVGIGAYFGWQTAHPAGVLVYLFGFLCADLGAPGWVALGGALMEPVESHIQEGFKQDARQTLQARPDLTVVGVTGSYGKTSTKFIVAELLRQQYNVYATPSSYNTPMGMCLAINEDLKATHQVLVLEYGIRYPGDMKELCDIAEPNVSVVTTVGIAHLDTMGSRGAIAEEKGLLVERTRSGGPTVLNADDDRVENMSERASGPVWRVSAEGDEDADITARNVCYDASGTSFVVRDDTGTQATFKTQLLGAHNVLNVLLGVAVGRHMGLRLRQMAHAARRIEPIEHRLQLRKRGEVTIIDDAFNSNPVGARNAVEILSRMNGSRRVIVTPGMIEMGDRQHRENEALGTHIAAHDIDLAILVGSEQTAPVRKGLLKSDFPGDRIEIVDSLYEAQEFLSSYLQPGDVVLYENDLPDQYHFS